MSPLATIVASTVTWAALSTLVVMVPGVAIAWALARREFVGRHALSTLVGLPLVLPPTAVGYLLLRLLADGGPLGGLLAGIDLEILLTWKAVVVACSVMALPLVVRTARVSFEGVDPRLEAMARTLGYGPWRTFVTVTLPLAKRGLAAAAILGFTRALGEFGATVTIAGSIPGRTQTIASAIFSAQQAGNEARAEALVLLALAVGFGAIFFSEWLTRPAPRPTGAPRGHR